MELQSFQQNLKNFHGISFFLCSCSFVVNKFRTIFNNKSLKEHDNAKPGYVVKKHLLAFQSSAMNMET